MNTSITIEEIYQEYLSGISMDNLSAKYHLDISKRFKEANFKTYTSAEARQIFRQNKIKLNWMFDAITNQEEAYIIGLFLSDGYVGINQLGLRLKESDKDLVKTVKDYFSKDITLQHYKNTYSFVVSSKEACKNAMQLGLLSRKTQKEIHIPSMNRKLIPHFIRGYFDGDGTIFKCNNGNNITLRMNICSPTIKILQEIKGFLDANDIVCHINKEERKGKECHVPQIKGSTIANCDMYRLFVNSKDSILKFYNFIYNDAKVYLKRKFDVFNDNKDCLKYIKHANTEVISNITKGLDTP